MTLPLRLPEAGPLLKYLSWVSSVNRNQAIDAARSIKVALATPGGAILLDLLNKSIELSPISIVGDERALAARNAQCFIASDLRRLLSDEIERLLEQSNDAGSERKLPSRTRRSTTS